VTPSGRRNALFITAAALAAVLAVAVRVQAETLPPKTTELGRGPVIVFVHGLGASRSDWMPTARKLVGRYRVVMVDLPGHGETPLPDPFSFGAVGEVLDQVLAKQNPDSTIVVAHQMGGRAVLAALAAHPGRVKGVMLVDVPVGIPAQIDDQQKKQFLEFMDRSYEVVSKMMFSNLGRDTTQSKDIFAMFSQTSPATVKAYVREGFYTDGNKDARALKVPMQILLTSRVFKADATPGATLKLLGWQDTTLAVRRVPSSGYWAMKDQPDTLSAWISAFSAQVSGSKK